MSKPNGGPAYPVEVGTSTETCPSCEGTGKTLTGMIGLVCMTCGGVGTVTVTHKDKGMSLRDHFAALAMQGMLANVQIAGNAGSDGQIETVMARWAYEQSDAMIAEREK